MQFLVGRHGLGTSDDDVTALVATSPTTLTADFYTPELGPKIHLFLVDDAEIVHAGTADPLGPGVRPFVFDQRLLAVSESSLHSLQADNEGLSIVDDQRIAERQILAEQGSGERWITLTHDPYLGETYLKVSLDESGESVEVDLDAMFDLDSTRDRRATPWAERLIVTDDWVIVPRFVGDGSTDTVLHFMNVNEPLDIEPLGTLRLKFDRPSESGPLEFTPTKSALLIGSLGECSASSATAWYQVVDLRGDTVPTETSRVEAPALARAALHSPTLRPCGSDLSYDNADAWGNELNVQENLVTGDIIALPYRTLTPTCEDNPGQGLALLDVSEPTDPRIVDDFSVPFLVTQYNHESGLLAGIAYSTSEREIQDSEECEGDLMVMSGASCIDYVRQLQVGVREETQIEVTGTADLTGDRVRMSRGRVFWSSPAGVRGLAFDGSGMGPALLGGGSEIERFNLLGSLFVASTDTQFSAVDTTDPEDPITVMTDLMREGCDGFSRTATHAHCRTGRSGSEQLALP
jgi:hypothetical protein